MIYEIDNIKQLPTEELRQDFFEFVAQEFPLLITEDCELFCTSYKQLERVLNYFFLTDFSDIIPIITL